MTRSTRPFRVLVTRPAATAGDVAARLEAAGLEAVCLPLIETRPVADSGPLDAALARFSTLDWVVFASAGAIRLVAARARELGIAPPRAGAGPRICAGPASAAVLEDAGWPCDLLVAPFSAERARDALLSRVGEGRCVLLPRAADGRDVIAPGLRAHGADVREVSLYETVADPRRAAEAVRRLSGGELDAVLFFSPSAVRALATAAAAGAPGGGAALLDGVAVACIGPTTARAVRAAGWSADVTAPDTTAQALVEALVEALAVRLRPQPVGAGR